MSKPVQVIRPAPQRPADDAALQEKALWLIATHAYHAAGHKVVQLYEPSESCELKPDAFSMLFLSWREAVIGPRKGKSFDTATARWAANEKRLNIQGIRMRPDKPFPVYQDEGGWFKNTYRQPQHKGAGDIQPFLKFMDRFLPDKRQREWLFDNIAHKQWKPWIPGTAVLFVADNEDGPREGKFGTGRGMFFNITHKLYGPQYSRAEDFDIIDGSSSQSTYTDWRHNSVLVTVDEAKSSPTSYRRGERSAVYEVLKNVVDPAPKRCRFKAKYGQAFDGVSYCSFMVACNHADAIAIPANDRRFTVLVNGRVMTVEESREFAAWMEDPANIAALSRFLGERDLSNFNMFQPLDTTAKQDMAELALTQVEGILRDLMDDKTQELVFTRYQMENEVELILTGGQSYKSAGGQWRGEFEGAWKAYCVLLKTRKGSPSRVRVNGKLTKLYCFASNRKKVEKLPDAARQASARRRGGIDTVADDMRRAEMFKAGPTMHRATNRGTQKAPDRAGGTPRSHFV
jgi:hypothetical protein